MTSIVSTHCYILHCAALCTCPVLRACASSPFPPSMSSPVSVAAGRHHISFSPGHANSTILDCDLDTALRRPAPHRIALHSFHGLSKRTATAVKMHIPRVPHRASRTTFTLYTCSSASSSSSYSPWGFQVGYCGRGRSGSQHRATEDRRRLRS